MRLVENFTVRCSQKLNDGDTALSEEYAAETEQDVNDIISQYGARCIEKSYVTSFNITVEIKR